ncbi:MAG: hypothetical protein LBI56_02375, partial [Puniceicoccales bacterium]|nr:hypothetical protein [Puniceicoccales bacterium]
MGAWNRIFGGRGRPRKQLSAAAMKIRKFPAGTDFHGEKFIPGGDFSGESSGEFKGEKIKFFSE